MPSPPVSTGGKTAIREHHGKSKAKGYTLIAVIGVILLSLAFAWSRPRSQANQQATIAWTNVPCEDSNGDQKVFDYSQPPNNNFRLHSSKGCWSGVLMPSDAILWRSLPLGDQHDWYYYVMLQNGQIKGPFGWQSTIRFDFPQSFSIQSTKDADIKFWKPPV